MVEQIKYQFEMRPLSQEEEVDGSFLFLIFQDVSQTETHQKKL